MGGFKSDVDEFLILVDKFPEDRRLEVLFGEWNLKDVLAHMNHWAIHDLECIENLMEGKEPYWAPDVDEFNKEGILKRKDWKWMKVYEEFVDLKARLIDAYSSLPFGLWNKKFWPKRKFTPKKFLEIDIYHYEHDHTPEIRKVLDKIK